MSDHDTLYHQLFGEPEMVGQLLRGFVDAALLDDLDLNGISRENSKFHSDTGKRRESDMVWRIPRHSGGDTCLCRARHKHVYAALGVLPSGSA